MFKVKEECPSYQSSGNPIYRAEGTHISRPVTCQNLFKSRAAFLQTLNSGVWGAKGERSCAVGWCDLGGPSPCCLPQTASTCSKTVFANPFLDLYFKWDQRSAPGSCQRRLVCYPNLPCCGRPQRLWPSLGFPRSTQRPYRSPQQGGDRVSVSCRVERVSGFICGGDCPSTGSASLFWAPHMSMGSAEHHRRGIELRQARSLSSWAHLDTVFLTTLRQSMNSLP